MIVPAEALPIIQAIAPAFTRPTLARFALLIRNGNEVCAPFLPVLRITRGELTGSEIGAVD
jgi:hypothetical protein